MAGPAKTPLMVISIAANWHDAQIHGSLRRFLEQSLPTTRLIVHLGHRSHIWWHTERWLMTKLQKVALNPSVSNFDQGSLQYLLAHISNVRLVNKAWGVLEEHARSQPCARLPGCQALPSSIRFKMRARLTRDSQRHVLLQRRSRPHLSATSSCATGFIFQRKAAASSQQQWELRFNEQHSETLLPCSSTQS